MCQPSNIKRAKLLDEKGLRGKTIELLSRREYSYAELEAKLLPFTEDEPLIYIVLDWMVEQGYQSDKRFACMFVRSKGLSGYGPERIRLDLNSKGIAEHLIEHAFEENKDEVIWPDEVDRLIEKKLKAQDISDMKVKYKIMGYLQRRGFTLDQIYLGFDRHKDKTAV
jgi:regulatory protein